MKLLMSLSVAVAVALAAAPSAAFARGCVYIPIADAPTIKPRGSDCGVEIECGDRSWLPFN